MNKIFFSIVFIVLIGFNLYAYNKTRIKNAENFLKKIIYLRDVKTDVCFVMVGNVGQPDFIQAIPCTKKVKENIFVNNF